MKKLTKETQTIIKNAVDIATTLGIESLVIDSFSLRGENKELGIAIIMPTKDVTLEFEAIGIGRVPLLKSRMQLLEKSDITFDVFKKDEETNIVANLAFVQGRTKLAFKCSDPKMIQAPKVINDPIFYEMQFNDEDVKTAINGIGTMSSEAINFSNTDDTIFLKISDSEGDTFSHELESKLVLLDDTALSLNKSYKAKTLRTIFTNYIRKDDNNILLVSITRRGVMRISVLGMFIYMFPER